MIMSLLRRREAGILLMIILFCAFVGFMRPRFLTLDQFRIILLLIPLILIGAMGQMLVIIARHVDLSIGSIQGLAAMLTALMFKFHPEIPWGFGFVVAIGVGLGLGVINGVLVTAFNLPAIIVTLGTLSLYRGLTFIVSNAKQIDRQFVPSALKAM